MLFDYRFREITAKRKNCNRPRMAILISLPKEELLQAK